MITKPFNVKKPRLFIESFEEFNKDNLFLLDPTPEGFIVKSSDEHVDKFVKFIQSHIISSLHLEFEKNGDTYFAVVDCLSYSSISKEDVYKNLAKERYPRHVQALASVYNKNYDVWIEEDIAYVAEAIKKKRHLVHFMIRHPNGLKILWPTKYFRIIN